MPDLSKYAGREQAFVKHSLLEKYLPTFAYKVGKAWDSIIYIDGFAGPWEVNDPNLSDSSFGVAIDVLGKAQTGLSLQNRNVEMDAILVEQDKNAFAKLKSFAATRSRSDFGVHALHGKFVDKIPSIQAITKNRINPFRFVFIDPKGWADIPMDKLKPLLKGRSCEVLINLMTRHITRFLDEDDRAASYNSLFGRSGVLEILRGIPQENGERSEGAVREYCKSLRDLCGFKHVSSAVILEPDKESVRYFLVYATNNPHGIDVFKRAEIEAARIQDDVRHESRLRRTGQPEFSFGGEPPKSRSALTLRDRYLDRARKRIVRKLTTAGVNEVVKYDDLFCDAMAFPLVTPDDLVNWLDSWKTEIELRLSKSTRRKPAADEDDVVIVTKPELIR